MARAPRASQAEAPANSMPAPPLTPSQPLILAPVGANQQAPSIALVSAAARVIELPSDRLLHHQENIQIFTMYALTGIGLVAAGAGLLAALGLITLKVAPLILLSTGTTLLTGRPITALAKYIFGNRSIFKGGKSEVH